MSGISTGVGRDAWSVTTRPVVKRIFLIAYSPAFQNSGGGKTHGHGGNAMENPVVGDGCLTDLLTEQARACRTT